MIWPGRAPCLLGVVAAKEAIRLLRLVGSPIGSQRPRAAVPLLGSAIVQSNPVLSEPLPLREEESPEILSDCRKG